MKECGKNERELIQKIYISKDATLAVCRIVKLLQVDDCSSFSYNNSERFEI